MDLSEKPLLEMMKWSEGDRDGRFLLRNESLSLFRGHKKSNSPKKTKKVPKSPREKRKAKHRSRSSGNRLDEEVDRASYKNDRVAVSLYENYPSSKFTRSITNPEIVRNLWSSTNDKRLRSSYQAIDELGTEESSVPIITESILSNKTILATDNDTAYQIVQGVVERFRLDADPDDFCIVEVTLPPVGGSGLTSVHGEKNERTERILADDECPAKLHTRWTLGKLGAINRNVLKFHLRRRSSLVNHFTSPQHSRHQESPPLPCLIDLSHTPSNTPSHLHHKKHMIASFPVEIGSRPFLLNPDSQICLPSPNIAPKHCAITQSYRGVYAIQPLADTALIIVNEQTVSHATPLPMDSIIKFSEQDVFKFTVSYHSQHSRSNSAVTDHIEKARERLGKAYSTDNLTPTTIDQDHLHASVHPSHNRTFSEHTLKGETGVIEGDENEEDKDQFDVTDDDATTGSITSIKTTRNAKKRHNSAPHSGDLLHFLEETPESELAVLPASISFLQQNESTLIQSLIADMDGDALEFKLAPAYALYMIARHHLSSEYHPESSRHHSLIHMIKQTCSLIKRAVKDNKNVAGVLALWMSNTSELLHFLRRDYRLCMFAHEYENTLTSIIHMAYKYFTHYMLSEIDMFLPAFLSESVEADKEDLVLFKHDRETNQLKEPDVVPHGKLTHQASLTSLYWRATNPKLPLKTKPTLGCILSTLKAAISLLHQCRVNSTLSILIFNHLFRHISMRLFNRLLTDPKYCTQSIGTKLMRRLERLKVWSFKEGLNMPAEDHLITIYQAAIFLQFSKKNPDNVHLILNSCNRLNSKQVAKLLANYELAEGEGSINSILKEKLMLLVVQNVDKGLISSGVEVTLEEDPNLQLPFLIPEQGYSCDTMRGLPVGLEEYLEHAINGGLCQLHITKDTLGCWVPPRMTTSNQRESPLSTQASTTQMSQTLPKSFMQNPYASLGDQDLHRHHSEMSLFGEYGDQLKIVTVKLRKANKTLGINICERKVSVSHNQTELLIFIKSLSEEGPAKRDGRVSEGDQILKVDSTVLRGFTKQMVIKLLSNSGNEVTLKLAKGAAEFYGLPDSSPFSERKGNSFSPQSYESSHSIKAHRRQLRQLNNMNLYKHSDNHPDYHPPVYNGYNQTAQWIQEQRDHNHYSRPMEQLKMASKPSQSLNSLIPEKDKGPLRPYDHRENPASGKNRFELNPTPPGSDISDTSSQHTHSYRSNSAFDSKFSSSILGMASKLHDPLSAKSSLSDYPMYPSSHRPSVDSQFPTGSDMPTSLSVQMSESSDPSGSQAYPSLMLEKLSMEVGCHTQSNVSSAGLTVSSVLEQLAQKSREAKERSGLKKNEVKGLDVDELELEKQRMKFLFYEQKKNDKDAETFQNALDKQAPMDSNTKVSEWVNKDQDMLMEDEDLMMNPEKLLQITNLQGKLESLKKMINDQRKKNREIQFAKERVKQSLQEEEKKSQQARTVRPFMKVEDQARWQKEQKKRMKEWEKLKREKTNDLQRYEVKEREGRSRLKAFEQHFGEVKKQLQACESSGNSRPLSSATDEFGSSKLLDEIPERDWTRPPRIMSTDSITTESSLLSGDNPEMPKDLISLDSDISIPDFNISAARNSPYSNRSDSSSPVGPVSSFKGRYAYNPDIHGSMEMRPLPHQIANMKLPLMRGYSADQDKRLRMLKEEHHHHISSMDNIPAYSTEDRALQLHQLRQEAIQTLDNVERPVLERDGHHHWSKSSTNVSHYKGSIDSSNVESSLSNTPDVIPEFLVKPIHQSSSAVNLPYQPQPSDGTKMYSYGKHSRPSSGLGFADGHLTRGRLPFGPSSSSNSTEFLNGRVPSKEGFYDKPVKHVADIHAYSSHGNVSNLHHRGNAGFDIDVHQQTDSNRLNPHSRKVIRQANSPSTHKYSHRRPDASLNGDDRSKYRSNTSYSHSNLFTVGHSVQKLQSEL